MAHDGTTGVTEGIKPHNEESCCRRKQRRRPYRRRVLETKVKQGLDQLVIHNYLRYETWCLHHITELWASFKWPFVCFRLIAVVEGSWKVRQSIKATFKKKKKKFKEWNRTLREKKRLKKCLPIPHFNPDDRIFWYSASKITPSPKWWLDLITLWFYSSNCNSFLLIWWLYQTSVFPL